MKKFFKLAEKEVLVTENCKSVSWESRKLPKKTLPYLDFMLSVIATENCCEHNPRGTIHQESQKFNTFISTPYWIEITNLCKLDEYK